MGNVTNTCFMNSLPRWEIFSLASFWRHQGLLASRTEHQEALSFAYWSHWSQKKCTGTAIIFLTDSFYLCGVTFDDVLQRSRKKEKM